MSYLLTILVFGVLVAGYYFSIGRKTTRTEAAAIVLALVSALPLGDGALLLAGEYARWDQRRVVAGVVSGRLSSTGAEGTRTIGGSRYSRPSRRTPWIHTINGFRFHDVLARVLLTGSSNAWVVEYRYPCGNAAGCWEREFVSHSVWSRLRVGQVVNVRTAKGQESNGRLDENVMLSTALAKLAIGCTLALAAFVLSGRWRTRRQELITSPAVVTSVKPITAGGKVQWRVGFAYFSADGAARESADEVYVAGLKPGDDCQAVYPRDRPDLGSLRVIDRASA